MGSPPERGIHDVRGRPHSAALDARLGFRAAIVLRRVLSDVGETPLDEHETDIPSAGEDLSENPPVLVRAARHDGHLVPPDDFGEAAAGGGPSVDRRTKALTSRPGSMSDLAELRRIDMENAHVSPVHDDRIAVDDIGAAAQGTRKVAVARVFRSGR